MSTQKETKVRKMRPKDLRRLLNDPRISLVEMSRRSGLHKNTLSKIKNDTDAEIWVKDATLIAMREQVLDLLQFLRSTLKE